MTCVTVWDLERERVEFYWWVETGVKAVELRWQLQDVYPATGYEVYFEYENHGSNYSHAAGYAN